MTWALGFIKPCVGSVFLVTDNPLIFLLSINIIISLAIWNTLSSASYLKDDYVIKQIFTHTVSLKTEQLKTFENESDFFSQQNLLLSTQL